MKRLLNAKVIAVGDGEIYFDNGIKVDYHPYETYVGTYPTEHLRRSNVKYYSPKHVKEDE